MAIIENIQESSDEQDESSGNQRLPTADQPSANPFDSIGTALIRSELAIIPSYSASRTLRNLLSAGSTSQIPSARLHFDSTLRLQLHQQLQQQQQPPPPQQQQQQRSEEQSSNADTPNPPSASRSLIRHDRAVLSPDDRNFFYSLHTIEAKALSVQPSNTGNDPYNYASSYHSAFSWEPEHPNDGPAASITGSPQKNNVLRPRKSSDLLDKGSTKDDCSLRTVNSYSKKGKQLVLYNPSRKDPSKISPKHANPKPLSLWLTYCNIITFMFIPVVLRGLGIKEKKQQQAWREKMGLISIIFGLTAFVAFFTFAFNKVVCGTPLPRTHYSSIPPDSVVVHGTIFNISAIAHPMIPQLHQKVRTQKRNGQKKFSIYLAPMTQASLQTYAGGHDASLLFQNVNGNCKPFIKPASNIDTTSYVNELGEFSQYFPCVMLDMKGSFVSPLAREQQPQKVPVKLPNYAFEFKDSCHLASTYRDSFYSMQRSNDVYYSWEDVNSKNGTLVVYLGDVIDLSRLKLLKPVDLLEPFKSLVANPDPLYGRDISTIISAKTVSRSAGKCLVELAKVGLIETDSVGCITSHVVLFLSLAFIFSIVLVKFAFALYFEWFMSWRLGTNLKHVPIANATASIKSVKSGLFSMAEIVSTAISKKSHSHDTEKGDDATTLHSRIQVPPSPYLGLPSCKSTFLQSRDDLIYTLFLVTSYSESEEGVRTTLDSLATCNYPNDRKLVIVICDGLITGSGNSKSTPDIVLSMMEKFTISPEKTNAYSYVAIASDAKRFNMARAYSGYYKYSDSTVPKEKQIPLPMLVVIKYGAEWEQNTPGVKAGNRGKRDSQVLLMGFLQKVMFNERMTDLENYMYMLIWKLVGRDVMDYETIMMVDADTKIHADSLEHLISCMMKDPDIMGLCGETQIANKQESWVTMIQVFEYFISHHLTKSFESVFGGVTCLPGCFSIYRIKAPKGPKGYWVPILVNPDIVERYSDNQVVTLHRKNLLLLGEDRYLSTLMLKTFPKRKQLFVPQAKCETIAPSEFKVLLDQRRRWINSTVHNLMELVIVRDLCGVFCVSMQCVVFIELIGTLTLPAALLFTLYLLFRSVIERPVPWLPLLLLSLILGLPGLLILVTAHQWSYVLWMIIYLISLPIWNLVLPLNAFWKFDDFSWGTTRVIEGGDPDGGHDDKHHPMNGNVAQFADAKIKKSMFKDWLRKYNNGGVTPERELPSWKAWMHAGLEDRIHLPKAGNSHSETMKGSSDPGKEYREMIESERERVGLLPPSAGSHAREVAESSSKVQGAKEATEAEEQEDTVLEDSKSGT